MQKKILLFLIFILIQSFAFASQNYQAKKITLKKINLESSDTLKHVDIRNWVGKKIVFLRMFNSKIDFDYTSFSGGTGMKGRPKYSECFDHEATVESVIPDSLGEFTVKILMNDKTHKEYVGHTFNSSLSRVALVEDIEKAEKFLKGKIFWMKVDYWYYLNEEKEQMIIKNGQRFKKVKVTGFNPSMDDNALYELTLTDEMGETGILNVNINNNNVEETMLNNSLLSKFFFKKDPRKMFDWDDEIWHDIENKHIYKGMLKEQAIMSWGEPDDVIDMKDGTTKCKYSSGGFFTVKKGKVDEIRQQ